MPAVYVLVLARERHCVSPVQTLLRGTLIGSHSLHPPGQDLVGLAIDIPALWIEFSLSCLNGRSPFESCADCLNCGTHLLLYKLALEGRSASAPVKSSIAPSRSPFSAFRIPRCSVLLDSARTDWSRDGGAGSSIMVTCEAGADSGSKSTPRVR